MEKIIVMGGGKVPENSLLRIALALAKVTSDEIKQLQIILAEEYGIELKKTVCLERPIPDFNATIETIPEILPNFNDVVAMMRSAQREARKSNWYVPKSIGKPCKGKFQKRK